MSTSKILHKIFIVFIFLNLAFSQTPKQRAWLEHFSQVKQVEWQKSRAHADSIAKSLGLPIQITYEDGVRIELQFFEFGRPFY